MIRRNTIQCSLVLEAVIRLGCHATADEVYEALAQEHPSISRGTVYRNLQRLCEFGQVRRREIPGGADRFDHNCTDHYHVKCTGCGRVFDVDMPYMADVVTSVGDAHGFVFTGHDIVFKGFCPECNSNPTV